MKLSDYVVGFVADLGVKHVFVVTGGGAMHLNDSIGTSGLNYLCTHHEQAAAGEAPGGQDEAVVTVSFLDAGQFVCEL